MSEETIVAVFDTAAHADAAVRELQEADVPAGAISRQPSTASGTTASEPVHEQGFWSNLFGGEPDHDTAVYGRSVQGGSHVVTVKIPDAHVAAVLRILENNNPIDIEDRAASYGFPATTATTTTQGKLETDTATRDDEVGDQKLQLSEEQLVVGKRLVNRGTTRIRRFVVETPVEQNVSLHEERVTIERHPVTDGRAVSGTDFTDRTIEMTETGEEAVVGKTARVVEEIDVRKQASDRTETVRDTVRREDVEIIKVPGDKSTATVDPLTRKPTI